MAELRRHGAHQPHAFNSRILVLDRNCDFRNPLP